MNSVTPVQILDKAVCISHSPWKRYASNYSQQWVNSWADWALQPLYDN